MLLLVGARADLRRASGLGGGGEEAAIILERPADRTSGRTEASMEVTIMIMTSDQKKLQLQKSCNFRKVATSEKVAMSEKVATS